jgi:hypothetical protein
MVLQLYAVANNQQQQDQQSSPSKTAGQRKSRTREGRRGQQQQLQEEAQKASPSPAGAGAPAGADDGNDEDDEIKKVPNSDRRRVSCSDYSIEGRRGERQRGLGEAEQRCAMCILANDGGPMMGLFKSPN